MLARLLFFFLEHLEGEKLLNLQTGGGFRLGVMSLICFILCRDPLEGNLSFLLLFSYSKQSLYMKGNGSMTLTFYETGDNSPKANPQLPHPLLC